jgi:carboxymethylenebutenolidase
MRTSFRTVVAAAALAAAVACSSSKPADKPKAAGPADAGAGSIAERIASTGPLSEAEFKALHELNSETPPPAKGEMIEVGGARAYLSLPPGATAPMPGIVVIHEWWGLNPHIQHWTDRLAGLGFAALAVDLYGGTVATTPDEAMAAMKAVDEATARRVLAAAVDFLAADPRIKAPRRGVIGWCFGGGWSLQTAIDHPQLDAAVMYYGRPDTDPARLGRIRAKLLGVFGNQDTGIPKEKVDELEAALKKAGVDAKILRYDADHAFANPSGPHYQETAATEAWKEVARFLADNLQPRT